MGDDSIETDQIVYNGSRAVPADYIDSMLALGWSPCLVVSETGEVAVFERYPDVADPAAVLAGYRISAWWMMAPGGRSAIIAAMRRRGLVRYL